MTLRREERGPKERAKLRMGGGRVEGEFSSHDRRVILTVGHTLILDLQVLVGPRAGVREDI